MTGGSAHRGRLAKLKRSALGRVHRRRAHFSEHDTGSWFGLPFTPVLHKRDTRHDPLQSGAEFAREGAGKLRDMRAGLRRSLSHPIGREGRRDYDHRNDVSASPHGTAQYPALPRDRQVTAGEGLK
jgi:hypothetical protein